MHLQAKIIRSRSGSRIETLWARQAGTRSDRDAGTVHFENALVKEEQLATDMAEA